MRACRTSQLGDLYRSVDKLDKIGLDGVTKELRESGIADDVIRRMMNSARTAPGHD